MTTLHELRPRPAKRPPVAKPKKETKRSASSG